MAYTYSIGDSVVSNRIINSGWASLPAGTVFTVKRRLLGYTLEGEACATCGVKITFSRVPESALDAYEPPEAP